MDSRKNNLWRNRHVYLQSLLQLIGVGNIFFKATKRCFGGRK